MTKNELLRALSKFQGHVRVVLQSDFEIKDIDSVHIETLELEGSQVNVIALTPVGFLAPEEWSG